MPELLKNIYNEDFFYRLTKTIKKAISDFNESSFLSDIFDDIWKDRELKQRMRHISIIFKKHLSGDNAENIRSIQKIIRQLQNDGYTEKSIEYMFFPDFIELYGIEYYNLAIEAFEEVTKFTSCEFAVRPFLIKYPEKMIQQMLLWSQHTHPMVRRLATEGCRPRLPWAMAIPSLKNNPDPIIPILEQLKNDESETVRRSVANNLNDISKDNPKKVIALAKQWKGGSKEVDKIIKHACRTLLKQGDQEIMRLFGFGSIHAVEIKNLKISTHKIKIGESLNFSFELQNTSKTTSKIRLEYGIYYQKSEN